ncbi:uncharacterized protein LOC144103686 [Amblyomma americanum]
MIAAALLLTCVGVASASTQTASIRECFAGSVSNILVIDDVTVSNVKVGSTMTLNYSVELEKEVSGSPQLVFTMTSGSTELPCLGEVGSCTYDICGGTGNIEQQIASPWNNTCPIPPGDYSNSLVVKIPRLAGIFITTDSTNVKIEGKNNGQSLGCVQFDIKVEK